MSNLTLDGSTRFIGTEFIKLEITGTSELATESYVNQQVALGGGTGSANLTNYYNRTEVDNLLNAKLNINTPPQDMEGTLRIGRIAGTSKIVINAQDTTKDFYVNGDAQVNGNHLVSSLNSSGFIQAGSILTNSFDATNTDDMNIRLDGDDYISLKNVPLETMISFKDINISGNTSIEGSITAKQDINVSGNTSIEGVLTANQAVIPTGGELQTNLINTVINDDLLFNVSGTNFFRLRPIQNDIFLGKPVTTFDDITSVESINSNVFNSVGDATLSLRRNNINMITFETNSTITFNRSWNFESTGQSLGFPNFKILEPFSPTAPFLHITGETDSSTIRFIVGNSAYRVLEVNYNTVDFRRPLKVTTINNNAEFSTALILDATSNISFRSTGLEYFRLDNGRNDMVASRDITCVAKFQGNTYNTNGNSDMVFERNGVEFFRLTNAPAGYPILNWTNTTPSAGISSSVIFANTYTTRSENQDTVFGGNPPSGSGNRVEYCRYDYANSQLSYSCVIRSNIDNSKN